MNIVYLQLGSNLGDRVKFLSKARSGIEMRIGDITDRSKIYESSPWRVDSQSNYLNQVLKLNTQFGANNVLKRILQIENNLGRRRFEKWGDRLIDIDIIFYNNSIIETCGLSVPHKHMHERRFVLTPLMDIADDYIHPKYKMTVAELLTECHDSENVDEYVI